MVFYMFTQIYDIFTGMGDRELKIVGSDYIDPEAQQLTVLLTRIRHIIQHLNPVRWIAPSRQIIPDRFTDTALNMIPLLDTRTP